MIKPLLGTAAWCIRENAKNLDGMDPETVHPFQVMDESMKPTFWPTDQMGIQTVEKWESGKVYAILTPLGQLQLRRVYALPDGRLVLATDTPEQDRFPCQLLSREEAKSILIVGRPAGVSSSAPFTSEGRDWYEQWGDHRYRHPCETEETNSFRW